MAPRDLRLLLSALTVVGAACVLPITLGAPIDLLLAAPVLLLALPLLAGRYVGEGQLARLAVRVRARRVAPRPRHTEASTGRAVSRRVPRGGTLLASSLAVRPPPVALSHR